MDSDGFPKFCFDSKGEFSGERMVKGLEREGYGKIEAGELKIHSSLKQDYPNLFQFLIGLAYLDKTTTLIQAIDEGKVHTNFNTDKKTYTIEEGVLE